MTTYNTAAATGSAIANASAAPLAFGSGAASLSDEARSLRTSGSYTSTIAARAMAAQIRMNSLTLYSPRDRQDPYLVQWRACG